MKKITLITIGTHGDVRPYVALGKGLHHAGFDVCVATHLEFKPFVEKNGLRFHGVQGNPRDVLESAVGQELMASGTNVVKFFQEFRNAAQKDMYDGFTDCYNAAQGADAIIFPFFVAGVGHQIARKIGCKTIMGYLQPTLPTADFPVLMIPRLYMGGFLNRLSHQTSEWLFWQFFHDVVDRWSRDVLAISPPSRWRGPFKALARQSLVLMGYSRHLVPQPRDWKANVHTTGFWLLPEADGYQPPADLEAFLTESPKPLYLGFGSMAEQDTDTLHQDIEHFLARTQQRAVVMSGWSKRKGEGHSDRIYHLEQVPHDWLFPKVSMVVHHGGAGTTATAAHAGVPQIIVPFFGDQPFWAQRIFGLQLGPQPIPRQQLNDIRLEKAVKQVLKHPRYAHNAQTLGQRMAQEHGVAQAVKEIQDFLDAP